MISRCSPAVIVEGEGRHRLTGLLAHGGGDHFLVVSNKNKLTRVTSWDSDGDRGFLVSGDGNRIQDNDVVNDPSFGIVLEAGAAGNLVTRNVSLGHETAEGFDLRDANGGACGGNVWTGNVFGTSDPAKGAAPTCIE